MKKLQKKLNENNKTVLFLIFLIFLVHQIYYIFIGGTTWDEPASILNGVKQLQKAKLFILDNSNLALQNIQGPEFYGGLIFIPAVMLTMSSRFIEIISNILSLTSLVNSNNLLEVSLIVRHVFLNLYIILILYLCYLKLQNMIGKNKSVIFVLIFLLLPSINGHGLFNFADIPLMMQFLLASIFYLSYLNNRDRNTVILLGFLFGLTLLTRLNAIAFLGALTLFELVYVGRFNNEKIDKTLIKDLVLKNTKIYLISLTVLIIGSPSAWKNIFDWFYGSYIYQFQHPQKAPTVLNGKLIIADEAPRTYLLEWFAYKLPIFVIAFFLLSIFLHIKNKNFGNIVTKFSLFFSIYVNFAFIVYNPVAYDEIRHYLFLVPFIVFLVIESLFFIFKKKESYLNISIIVFVFYLVSTQYGLQAYKYAYLNELVDSTKISIECEDNLSQSGCGDWHTDYWGFGGKQLYKISKKYSTEVLYFCPPHFTYSLFQDEYRPWKLIGGSFSFDDSYTFAQDEIIYYQSHMLEKINSDDFEEITFISLNYHRPPTDSCGLTKLDRSKFDIDCELLDGVKVSLRGQEIWINYLSECNIQKLNT